MKTHLLRHLCEVLNGRLGSLLLLGLLAVREGILEEAALMMLLLVILRAARQHLLYHLLQWGHRLLAVPAASTLQQQAKDPWTVSSRKEPLARNGAVDHRLQEAASAIRHFLTPASLYLHFPAPPSTSCPSPMNLSLPALLSLTSLSAPIAHDCPIPHPSPRLPARELISPCLLANIKRFKSNLNLS
jgi:hypothetical protein